MKSTMESDETKIAVLVEQVKGLTTAVTKMDGRVDQLLTQFVTRAEFTPIKQIVYGMVGLALVAVVVTVLLNLGLKFK